jgi:hypothetical protein
MKMLLHFTPGHLREEIDFRPDRADTGLAASGVAFGIADVQGAGTVCYVRMTQINRSR